MEFGNLNIPQFDKIVAVGDLLLLIVPLVPGDGKACHFFRL